MDNIEKFMLPENTNRLYENEVISSISLTRDVAEKINELVDAYNELSKMDLEWKQEQDGRTRKAILYMKDNLVNSLNDLTEQLIASGFVDVRIAANLSTLTARLNNLVGAVTTGSTTMDAEIIDARLGSDRISRASLGESIRVQIENIQDAIDSELSIKNNISTFIYDSDSIGTFTRGKALSIVGKLNDTSNNYGVLIASVKPRQRIKIRGSAAFGSPKYAFFHNDDLIELGEFVNDVSTLTRFDEEIVVPFNANKIVINFHSDYDAKCFVSVSSVVGIRKYIDKKWVAFGDSLTEINSKSNKAYHQYISEETGINVLNYGVSGTGYARTDQNFYTRVLQLADVDFDVITLFGSGNDLGSGLELGTANDTETTTIAGCINKTLDNLFSVKPFVSVGIITPTPWNGNTPDIEDADMKKYSDLLIEIAKKRSIPVLDLYRESNLHPESETFRKEFYFENGVQDNGVHPNAKGHKKIAAQIREFIAKLI